MSPSRPHVDVAVEAALAAARVVVDARGRGDFRVTQKARADFVTEVDLAAEAAACAIIRRAHPDHAILAEEGATGGDSGEWRWVVDPLDGTTNFIRGIPFFAVSIALEHRGVPVAAAIVDPLRDEVYSAARGAGAFLGERRLSVSRETDMRGALALTGIPFRRIELLERFLPGLERIARASAGIRRMGSAALDLCAVAAGRAEVFWEHGLGRWDVSAGQLLVEEAGGRVGDHAGGRSQLETGDVLATNGHVHAAMLELLAE